MIETWFKNQCPQCRVQNWLQGVSWDDITSYTCWSCKRSIRLYSGQFGVDYDPHVEGTRPYDDESACGWDVDGLEAPK